MRCCGTTLCHCVQELHREVGHSYCCCILQCCSNCCYGGINTDHKGLLVPAYPTPIPAHLSAQC
jgi:hypothetical protein